MTSRLVELNNSLRIVADSKTLSQVDADLRVDDMEQVGVVDLGLQAGTSRHRVVATVGATFLRLIADNPVTVYFGNSLEGHEVNFLILNGEELTEGIYVDTESDTTLSMVIAR